MIQLLLVRVILDNGTSHSLQISTLLGDSGCRISLWSIIFVEEGEEIISGKFARSIYSFNFVLKRSY